MKVGMVNMEIYSNMKDMMLTHCKHQNKFGLFVAIYGDENAKDSMYVGIDEDEICPAAQQRAMHMME
jgi:hypothetical protein